MIVSFFKIDSRQFDTSEATRLAQSIEEAGRVGRALLFFPEGIPDSPSFLPWLKGLCRAVVIAVRGGISTPDPVETLVRAGVTTVVIEEATPFETLSRMPRDRTVVALDPDNYRQYADVSAVVQKMTDKMNSLAPWVSGFMIDVDWSPEEVNQLPLDTIRRFRDAAGSCLWVRHPTLTADDTPAFDELGIDAVVHDGDIRVYADAFIRSLNFHEGLIPTVAVDKYGQVLRVAWSSPRSLSDSIIRGTSGYCGRNGVHSDLSTGVGRLLRVIPDEERAALMFVVRPPEQNGTRFSYSSFGPGGREFGLQRLFDIIHGLKERPRPGSYTSFLFEREDRIPRKLNEEVRELLEAGTRDEIAWEAADVLFFLFAYLAGTDVPLDDVVAELMGRKQ
ncbi:MAG TPA: phosphoribosyl-ATP diphosphatase [Myxococcota bacterium]|nr:phosphoribosyl-ATP diphosphatase [Myxococcota bacterium]HOA13771.1 phosphoribosyl-ATP diphosphatase [Myxococcota bacterium]HOC98393.1 phosphoribosyl-ATP diphosphatase [Myxococcota bacterium]HOH76783.1 phosphoribosyl-ATP diphosphatase [Myxococcota bacterium]HPV03510.1 phosphoribosyl-ATP diphosphatase [Myxococcota bacterium]